ncbi:MAG: hypothetical protein R3316_13030 [Rhodovibrionaceae bacterium]|nr:hypothetical protein [Rhodovibrionaceae bacterium]
MSDWHQNLIDRFPEFEKTIRKLLGSHSDFNEKAHEFTEVQDRLREAESRADSPQDEERLRKRHEALREELLSIMEDHSRI